jgi:hypothetical protein
MPRSHDDDALDERGLLKDGRAMRVPLMMRDSASLSELQRSVMGDGEARDAARRFGLNDSLALHRPGQRFCTDQAARDAVEEIYQDEKRKLQDAWRQPVADSETSVGSHEFRGQQPGDQCTINGAPGHLNHRLECIPDRQDSAPPRTMTADAAQRIRDAAYEESVRELTEAWRRPAR